MKMFSILVLVRLDFFWYVGMIGHIFVGSRVIRYVRVNVLMLGLFLYALRPAGQTN